MTHPAGGTRTSQHHEEQLHCQFQQGENQQVPQLKEQRSSLRSRSPNWATSSEGIQMADGPVLPTTQSEANASANSDAADIARLSLSPAGPGKTEDTGAGAQKRPAVLNLQSLRPRGTLCAGSAENADEASPTDGPGTSGGGTTRRAHVSHQHHVYHRQHSHSPSVAGSMASSCGILQAVPEDAVVDSPSTCEAPGSAGPRSVGSPALISGRSVSSSFCSEISIDSPSINLTLPCQEMPSGMLVAMVNRSAEMRDLYERNAPFFESITSGVFCHTPLSAENTDHDDVPPRVKQFLDTLFTPREQLPDRLWIDAIESHLSAAPPAVLETFRELVGYESEDECDDASPDRDQIWLPEYDDLEDASASRAVSDTGSESDSAGDLVIVSRELPMMASDDIDTDKGNLGSTTVHDIRAVKKPSDYELTTSLGIHGFTGAKEREHEDEEGKVEALAV